MIDSQLIGASISGSAHPLHQRIEAIADTKLNKIRNGLDNASVKTANNDIIRTSIAYVTGTATAQYRHQRKATAITTEWQAYTFKQIWTIFLLLVKFGGSNATAASAISEKTARP
jgi:hypothetical protein